MGDLDQAKILKTMRYLKLAFTLSFCFLLTMIISRFLLHMWTNKLEARYNKANPVSVIEYWCIEFDREGKSFDNRNDPPCVLIEINSYIIFGYLICVLLQYSVTYLYLIRLACCPKKEVKTNQTYKVD